MAVPRPRRVDYLQDDEHEVLSQRRHPLSVLDELVGIAVLWAFVSAGAIVLGQVEPRLWLPVGVPVLAVAALGAMALGIARWWRTMTSLYTVTDARVYEAYGRFRWYLLQTTFDKITDTAVRQGVFGRWFGYGSLRLMTAGTGLSIAGVRRPWDVKKRIEDTRSAFLDRLVGETPPQVLGDDTPAPARTRGMGEVVWQGAPQPASVLGPIVSGTIMLLVASAIAVGGALGAGRLALPMAALFFLAGAAGILRAGLALRFTRFHVHRGGVVVASGWLTRRRVEATYSKVTDVQTTQGVLGRMFGFGEIRINTAGSDQAPIVFQGVADPERVKALVDEVRGA